MPKKSKYGNDSAMLGHPLVTWAGLLPLAAYAVLRDGGSDYSVPKFLINTLLCAFLGTLLCVFVSAVAMLTEESGPFSKRWFRILLAFAVGMGISYLIYKYL